MHDRAFFSCVITLHILPRNMYVPGPGPGETSLRAEIIAAESERPINIRVSSEPFLGKKSRALE